MVQIKNSLHTPYPLRNEHFPHSLIVMMEGSWYVRTVPEGGGVPEHLHIVHIHTTRPSANLLNFPPCRGDQCMCGCVPPEGLVSLVTMANLAKPERIYWRVIEDFDPGVSFPGVFSK